jgi:hypothetical protein
MHRVKHLWSRAGIAINPGAPIAPETGLYQPPQQATETISPPG